MYFRPEYARILTGFRCGQVRRRRGVRRREGRAAAQACLPGGAAGEPAGGGAPAVAAEQPQLRGGLHQPAGMLTR